MSAQRGGGGVRRANHRQPVHTTVLPDSRIYLSASFDREEAYGLEAKAEFLPSSGLSGYLNYAFSRVNFFNTVTGGFVTEAAHLAESSRFLAPMDQTHTLAAGATYRHDRSGVSLSTTLEYGSGTPMGHGSPDDDHADEEGAHTHAGSGGTASRVPGHLTARLLNLQRFEVRDQILQPQVTNT